MQVKDTISIKESEQQESQNNMHPLQLQLRQLADDLPSNPEPRPKWNASPACPPLPPATPSWDPIRPMHPARFPDTLRSLPQAWIPTAAAEPKVVATAVPPRPSAAGTESFPDDVGSCDESTYSFLEDEPSRHYVRVSKLQIPRLQLPASRHSHHIKHTQQDHAGKRGSMSPRNSGMKPLRWRKVPMKVQRHPGHIQSQAHPSERMQQVRRYQYPSPGAQQLQARHSSPERDRYPMHTHGDPQIASASHLAGGYVKADPNTDPVDPRERQHRDCNHNSRNQQRKSTLANNDSRQRPNAACDRIIPSTAPATPNLRQALRSAWDALDSPTQPVPGNVDQPIDSTQAMTLADSSGQHPQDPSKTALVLRPSDAEDSQDFTFPATSPSVEELSEAAHWPPESSLDLTRQPESDEASPEAGTGRPAVPEQPVPLICSSSDNDSQLGPITEHHYGDVGIRPGTAADAADYNGHQAGHADFRCRPLPQTATKASRLRSPARYAPFF